MSFLLSSVSKETLISELIDLEKKLSGVLMWHPVYGDAVKLA